MSRTLGPVRSVDEYQIAKIDERADALSRNKHRVLPVDGIGECDEPADQAHIPKGDGNAAFGVPFRRDPLNHPATEKETLAEEADADPNYFDAHDEVVLSAECWATGLSFNDRNRPGSIFLTASMRGSVRSFETNPIRVGELSCVSNSAIEPEAT